MSFDPTRIGKAYKNLPPRIVISGDPKSGKTTFAACGPKPLIVPITGEEGCYNLRDPDNNPLDVDATPVVNSWKGLIEIATWFRDGDHQYKSFVLDSLSSAARMRELEIIKADGAKSLNNVGGGFGKGAGELEMSFFALNQILTQIQELRRVPICLIAHVKLREAKDKVSQESYDAYEFALNGKLIELYKQWPDGMCFATEDTYISSEGKATAKAEHKLILHGYKHLPVGFREIEQDLPKEIPLRWQSFQDAVKAAKNQTKKD